MASVNELKDVLKETLEERGILAQIRARIRAEIFNSLNDQPNDQQQLSMENMIINDLIREYMQYNNYNHSLSVFTPESGMPEDMLDRNFIGKKLKIVEDSNSRQMPLLYGLVFGMKKMVAQEQAQQIQSNIDDNSQNNQNYQNIFPQTQQIYEKDDYSQFRK